MSRSRKLIALALASVAAIVLTASSCEEPSAADQQRELRNGSFEELAANQPIDPMAWSPTRETVDFWLRTWEEPDKLSYVYLLSGDGQYIGYYVLQGLPVSYCVMSTPNYDFEKPYGSSGVNGHLVPAPAMDGVYYAGEGSCDTYYGIDATTGSYIEYTAGMGINVLLYDQPLALPEGVEPPALGFTELDDIEE